MEEEPFKIMNVLYQTPIVQDFYHHVAKTAGFTLPPSFKSLFDKHHQHFFTDPCPIFTADWGTASPNWRWQKIHFESIIGSTQSAVAAVLYHRENLVQIERDVLSFPEINQLISIMGKSGFGGGNTQKLDFEYHGFIFSFRRTLDYLARGIAALLHQDFNSFRRLPKFLTAHHNHQWVQDILQIHSRDASKLDSFLGNRTDKSVRDKVAHYLHVPAGSLNVNTMGVFFAGGGEELNTNQKLTTIIDGYVIRHVAMAFVITTRCFA